MSTNTEREVAHDRKPISLIIFLKIPYGRSTIVVGLIFLNIPLKKRKKLKLRTPHVS